MLTEPSNRSVLAFGDFRLIPERRQLRRFDVPLKVGTRAYELLRVLASRAGQVVGYEELLEAAWPNCVVSPVNLRVQIAALQKLLGTMPEGGRFIESVATRGYVFVGRVRRVPDRDSMPEAAPNSAKVVLVFDIPFSRLTQARARMEALLKELAIVPESPTDLIRVESPLGDPFSPPNTH